MIQHDKSAMAHIRTIICLNDRDTAASYIYLNGYARTLEDAYKLIDKENGHVRN